MGSEEVLLKSDREKRPEDWSLDGRFIVYLENDRKTSSDLWVLPMTGDGKPGKPEPVVQAPNNQFQWKFSPDGKWIAYTSAETQPPQIYVQGFPIPGRKYQISTNGGQQPRWRRDGKELYFLTATDLMAVEMNTSKDGAFHAGVPQKLFPTNALDLNTGRVRNSYDVTPDGQRFLINSPVAPTDATPITVIVNWNSQGQTAKAP